MRGFAIVFLVGCASSTLGYLHPPPGTDSRVGFAGLLDLKYASAPAKPPVSLVPSDGSELGLVRLGGEVTINGPIAHTKLHFTFVNTEDRTREGRFSLTLPSNAAVTQFAMKIQGEWREGKIVARQYGREVYERFLHRNTDPALLEQDLGNTFSARVFPIFGGEHKEIIVAYDHAVSDRYDLSLRGLPRVRELQITVDNNGDRRTTAEHDALPQDVHVELVKGAVAATSGEAFVARVDAEGLSRTDAPLDRVLYLVDTSASRAPVMAAQLHLLENLLWRSQQVAVALYDQNVVEIYRGAGRDARLDRIREHRALGASNLGAALERARLAGMSRVVIIGDGAATAGERDVAKLAALLSGVERVDVVQVGENLDRTTTQALVRAGRKPGAIIDGRDFVRASQQLQASVGQPVAIRVDGATNVWPTNTRHVAPGEPVFVYGLRDGAEDAPLVIHVGERTVTVTPRKGRELRRTVAYQELADLVEESASAKGDAATKLGDKIQELAVKHSLISPRTSLIVLETEWDEQRFLDPCFAPAGSTNIPTGRTFQAVLGAAAGSQADTYGVSFSGSTSLENQYYIDGINTTGLSYGESVVLVSATAESSKVRADTQSALSLDLTAEALQRDAFAFKNRSVHDSWEPPGPTYKHPYSGTFQRVMSAIAKHDDALEIASKWHAGSPGDVTAIIALGEALEAKGAAQLAMRAYGSIADLYPNRAELLRAAAERLDRIQGASDLAIDFYRRALKERPDHVTTYRLLAYALFRANRANEALDVILDGARVASRSTVQRLLAEDAGIIGASIVAREPARRYEIVKRLPLGFATTPSLRFVLSWETDATNVDLVVDGRGKFLEDARDGYGPEAFVADKPSGTYKLAAHYENKAQAGVGLGTVQIIRHDGAGGVTIENRPFAIQTENGRVELGKTD